MKTLVLACAGVLALAACQSTAPYYDAGNYQPTDWAQKSFDEAKAICRHDSLKHNVIGDTYELQTPRYKACMEKEGYRFNAKTNWTGSVKPNPAPLLPRAEISTRIGN